MITTIIISNTLQEEFFNLTIDDKFIQKKFSEVIDREEKTNLENLITLIKTSNANLALLNNFNDASNIELFLYLKNYNVNEFKEFDFNNLNVVAKQACSAFFNYYLEN